MTTTPRTLDEVLTDLRSRVRSLERRLTGGAGGGTAPGMIGAAAKSISTDQGSATRAGNKVTFTNVGRVSLNGVFDPAVAQDYLIECVITGQTNGGWIRMRKANVDTTSNSYGNQQVWNPSASALQTSYSASSGWSFTPTVGTLMKFTARITSATVASPLTCYLDLDAVVQLSGGLTNGNNKGTHNAASYDGFTVQAASGVISGWLRVYALT